MSNGLSLKKLHAANFEKSRQNIINGDLNREDLGISKDVFQALSSLLPGKAEKSALFSNVKLRIITEIWSPEHA